MTRAEQLQAALNAYYLTIADCPARIMEASTPMIRNGKPNTIEQFGMEALFIEIIKNQEEDTEGQFYSRQFLEDSFCWSDGVLNLMDEYTITDDFSFSSLWMTENHVVIAEVYDNKTEEMFHVRLY